MGWRGESYRHYLAAKGVKTTPAKLNFSPKLYFSTIPQPATVFAPPPQPMFTDVSKLQDTDMLKGNRMTSPTGDNPDVKRLRTKGWTDEKILANSQFLLTQLDDKGIPLLSVESLEKIKNKESLKKSEIPEAPISSLASSVEPLPAVDLPLSVPAQMTQPIRSAPNVDLVNLEDELPSRDIGMPVQVDEEATKGKPKGLRLQEQLDAATAPSVATPGAPEISDYDLRT
jgi:hypothetical protein